MLRLLRGIRAQETSYAIRMARIRAFNMALYFFITPLVSFIVFTVVSCTAPCSWNKECCIYNACLLNFVVCIGGHDSSALSGLGRMKDTIIMFVHPDCVVDIAWFCPALLCYTPEDDCVSTNLYLVLSYNVLEM